MHVNKLNFCQQNGFQSNKIYAVTKQERKEKIKPNLGCVHKFSQDGNPTDQNTFTEHTDNLCWFNPPFASIMR